MNRIKESLTRFFAADRSEFPEGYREIEDCFNQLPGEPYPTIAVNDVGKDEPPDVTDTPGVRYAVTESDFW